MKKSLSKKIIAVLLVIIICFLTIRNQVYANRSGNITNPVIGELGKPSGQNKDGTVFFTYAVSLWRSAITLGGIAVLGLYIWGAFEWIASGSDSKGVDKGRNRILNATIGLVILVSVFTIVGFMSKLFFGNEFNILQVTFPSATKQTYTRPILPPASAPSIIRGN